MARTVATPIHGISTWPRWYPSLPLLRTFAWACMGTMVLAVPLALDPINVTSDPAVSAKVLTLRLIEGVWAIALVLAYAGGGMSRFSWRAQPPLVWALAAIPSAAALSLLFSGRLMWVVSENIHLLLLPVLTLATHAVGRPRLATLRAVLLAMLTGGILCALYGFGVMIGRDPLREVYPFVYSRDDARNFLHSFLGNPEYFGGYSAAIAAAGAALVLYGRHLGDRAVGAIVSAIMGVCVVLSGTRAALLVLAAVILLLLAARWASLTQLIRRRILMVGAATATIGLIGVVILSTENPLNPRGMRLAQRFASLGDPNSASVKERILFYAIAAETVVRNPILGSGPGTYQLEFYPRLLDMDERDERGVIARLMYDLRNRVAENAHSDWLQAWSEGGAIGGAAFALLGAALLGGFFCWARDPGWYCRIEATEIPKIGESGQVTSPSVQESANLGGLTSEAGVVAAGFAGAFCLYLNSAFSFPLQMSARAGLFYAMVGLYLAAATHRR